MTPFLRLKKRCEFLCVYNAQLSAASKTMIIQLYARNDDSYLTRVGFTVSRKVGNAVQRNRARRRLKAVAQEVLPFFPLHGKGDKPRNILPEIKHLFAFRGRE